MAIYSKFSRFTDFLNYDIPCESSARVNFVPVMTVVLAMMSQHPELVEFQVSIMKQS